MKQLMCILLIGVVLCLLLIGCGKTNPGQTGPAEQSSAAQPAAPGQPSAQPAAPAQPAEPSADGGQSGQSGKAAILTNRKIPAGDVTEFYYTYENINFDAFYQRYRFYTENGACLFYHETRERPKQYGPTTEQDITASGTVTLTAEEWNHFLELLKDGTVSKRGDSAESGGSGPWTYLYWKGDKGKYQEFAFASYGDRTAFEEFCISLAERS